MIKRSFKEIHFFGWNSFTQSIQNKCKLLSKELVFLSRNLLSTYEQNKKIEFHINSNNRFSTIKEKKRIIQFGKVLISTKKIEVMEEGKNLKMNPEGGDHQNKTEKYPSRKIENHTTNEKKKEEGTNFEPLPLSELWDSKLILLNFQNHLFEIVLNRPEKLNAINKDMITILLNSLKSLEKDDRVFSILIRSKCNKAFCAGSDVIQMIQNKSSAIGYMRELYLYMNVLSGLKKKVISIWNGYIMGGGVGISIYSSQRIVTDNTKFAMPEVKIGFFPDIGSAYFMNQYFGRNIGLHLGITGMQINEQDLLNFKVCQSYIPLEKIDYFVNKMRNIQTNNAQAYEKESEDILKTCSEDKTKVDPLLTDELIDNINRYYENANTVSELINHLKQDEEKNSFCKTLLQIIKNSCKVSVEFWYTHFLYNRNKTLHEVFNHDFILSQYFLLHLNSFEKSVEEKLIKKNHSYIYETSSIEEIQIGEPLLEQIISRNDLLSIIEEFK